MRQLFASFFFVPFALRRGPALAPFFLSSLLLLSAVSYGEGFGGVEFKADLYQRDLQTNTVRGKGNAWLKKDSREIWADQIEFDLTTKRAIAEGNVHIRDTNVDVWCRHASYNMAGDDAVMDDVVLVSGQLVVAGSVVRRVNAKTYQVEEGSYTNCNIDLSTKKDVSQCSFDWKLYGRHFSLTIEDYAHIHDALVYIREIPVFYLPYLIAPVKSKRQTGLLMPGFSYSENLGNGIRVPLFFALSSWQDLTLTPAYYSKTGVHMGFNYRYLYSDRTRGEANVFLLQRRFSENRVSPGVEDLSRSRFGGVVGEAAINIKNNVHLGGRTNFRQILKYVSDPYYTVDYAGDLNLAYDAVSLRSQIALNAPGDRYFSAAKLEHHQSLLVSEDSGVDRGGVSSLPTLYFSKANSTILDRYFSFEFDSAFSNFFRPDTGYDSVPLGLTPGTPVHTDPNPEYHDGNYIRTGRRLHIEPRLVANIPAPTGVQIQPITKLGLFLYHFDYPESRINSRQYLDLELPVSLYFQKTFETDWKGYERFSHVLQPRFVYAKRLVQTGDTTHPFYYKDSTRNLSNPRFDILDQLTPFEYMRFELINRFRRKTDTGSDRFFRFQLSNQYNLVTDSDDPRFEKRLGPIELLGELQIWRFYSQFEGQYQMEMTENSIRSVRENSISSIVEYRDPGGDLLSIGNRIRINIDDNLTEKTLLFAFYKKLPLIFDLEGRMEYSYRRGDLLGARFGMLFASKPRSCWSLNFQFGQDDLKRKFVRFLFALDFGSPSDSSGKGT